MNSCLPAQGVCTGCVSGEEAWLALTDDSSSEVMLASGIPMACLLLVKLGSDLNGAGRILASVNWSVHRAPESAWIGSTTGKWSAPL